jgi:hypothetical protein
VTFTRWYVKRRHAGLLTQSILSTNKKSGGPASALSLSPARLHLSRD